MRWVFVVVLLAGCDQLWAIQQFQHDASIDVPIDARDGLVAWFQMEGLDANNMLADVSGAHAGTCGPTCPTPVAGRVQNGLAFDGLMDQITIDGGGDLRTPNAFTATAWIWMTVYPTDAACPLNKAVGSLDGNSWQLCIETDGELAFFYSSGMQSHNFVSGPSATINTGAWHHVALRYDGTSAVITLDGIDAASQPSGPLDFDARPMTFGADQDNTGTNNGFGGIIDEVRIYNVALTEQQLLAQAGGF